MFLTNVLRSVAVLFSLLQSLNGLCNISVIFIIGDLCHHQSTMMTNIRPLIAISFTRSRAYIQGAFFYCSAQKTTKYKEKLKYQNCSANCSSQKILSTRKKQSIRTETTAHVYSCISTSRVSKHFLHFLIRPDDWYRNLLVSDECWFTLNGHVYNR